MTQPIQFLLERNSSNRGTMERISFSTLEALMDFAAREGCGVILFPPETTAINLDDTTMVKNNEWVLEVYDGYRE